MPALLPFARARSECPVHVCAHSLAGWMDADVRRPGPVAEPDGAPLPRPGLEWRAWLPSAAIAGPHRLRWSHSYRHSASPSASQLASCIPLASCFCDVKESKTAKVRGPERHAYPVSLLVGIDGLPWIFKSCGGPSVAHGQAGQMASGACDELSLGRWRAIVWLGQHYALDIVRSLFLSLDMRRQK